MLFSRYSLFPYHAWFSVFIIPPFHNTLIILSLVIFPTPTAPPKKTHTLCLLLDYATTQSFPYRPKGVHFTTNYSLSTTLVWNNERQGLIFQTTFGKC